MNTDDLQVLTIDAPETRLREDGFCFDHTTGDFYIVCVIPDYGKSNFKTIESRILHGSPRKLARERFFESKEGLEKTVHTPVIFSKFFSQSNTASIGLGRATLRKSYTFISADELSYDRELVAIRGFARERGFRVEWASKSLVAFLLRLFNDTVIDSMSQKNIPYLSSDMGRISISRGRFTINKPYRDLVSYINVAQLSTWLEKGEPPFTRNDLKDFVRAQFHPRP